MKKSFLKIIGILVIIILANGCDTTSEKTRIGDHAYVGSLIKKSVDKGDTAAFKELSHMYILEAREKELFYYAQIIANKYDNKDAHFLLYWTYIHPNDENSLENVEQIQVLDINTKNLALYHLLRSYELKESSSEYIVKEIFGDNNTILPSSFYLKQIGKCETETAPTNYPQP